MNLQNRLVKFVLEKRQPKRQSRKTTSSVQYQRLEDKRLLATLGDFVLLGRGETYTYLATARDEVTGPAAETYTVNLQLNQYLSVRANSDDSLQPSISVTGPGGNALGVSGAGDSTVLLQDVLVELPGDYTVSVGGFNGTVGEYEIEVLLNAVFEVEFAAEFGAGENDSIDQAQSVTSFVDPGMYAQNSIDTEVEVATVYGTLIGEGFGYRHDFESGSLSGDWTTSSSTTGGVIEVTDQYGADESDFALILSNSQNGVANLNEAVFTTTFKVWRPFLSFTEAQWGESVTPLPDTYIGSVDGDGVSISFDGNTWHTIFTPAESIDGSWNDVKINLFDVLRDAGIENEGPMQLKFQQFGDSTLPNDGRGYDNINLTDSYFYDESDLGFQADDWYSFTVDEMQPVSIGSYRTNGRASDIVSGVSQGSQTTSFDKLTRTAVSLFDDQGTLIESGRCFSCHADYGWDSNVVIQTLSPGTYFVRVVGDSYENYTLTIAKNGTFAGAYENPDLFEFEGGFLSTNMASLSNGIDPLTGSGIDISIVDQLLLQEGLTGGPIYTVATGGAFTAPTGESVFGSDANSPSGFQVGVNELRGDFEHAVNRISIDVGSDDANDSAFLRAYSAAGDLLEEVVSGPVNKNNNTTLTIRRPRGDIAYFIAAGTDGDATPLDNLEFFSSRGFDDAYQFRSFELGSFAAGEAIRIDRTANRDTAGTPFNNASGGTRYYLFGSDGLLVHSAVDTFDYRFETTDEYRLSVLNIEDETRFGGFFIRGTKILRSQVWSAGLMYGGSAFDDPADPYDAIVTDKSYFFNGQTATFENYTSYSNGINKIYYGIRNSSPFLDVDDFTFRTGTTDDTSSWTDAPSPTLTIVSNESGGADGVFLEWANGAITNTWLQVKLIPDAGNGIENEITLYYGNVVAETGNDPSDTRVNLVDVGLTRANQTGFNPADIENRYDFNRDSRVNLVDVGLSRFNQTGFFTLPLITPFVGTGNRSAESPASKINQSLLVIPSKDEELLLSARSEFENGKRPSGSYGVAPSLVLHAHSYVPAISSSQDYSTNFHQQVDDHDAERDKFYEQLMGNPDLKSVVAGSLL